MPWGFGRGFGMGRGLGFWATGLPGWARGWPKGYCWYYYQQTGSWPSWSPWSQIQIQQPAQDLAYLENLKKSLESQLREIERQINELKKKTTGEQK